MKKKIRNLFNSDGSLGRTSAILMIFTALSRLLGFFRIAVIGAFFGSSGTADVLNAVFMIPNNLRKLLAEGALSSALIPQLTREIVAGENHVLLVQRVMSFLLAIVTVIVIIALIFSRPIVMFLMDFPEVWKLNLSVKLFRIIFPYLLLVSVSALLMAVLHCHKIFIVSAISPLLFSVFVISGIVLFYNKLGVISAALGILIGGAVGIFVQLPRVMRCGYQVSINFNWRDPILLRVLKNWLPIIVASSLFAVSQQVAIYFASGLSDGSTSAISNALVFWQLPFGILSTSVVGSHFPAMSIAAAKGQSQVLKRVFTSGYTLVVSLLLPAVLVYLFFGEKIIMVALERMTFSHKGTLMASSVLFYYSLGMVSVGIFNFCQRFFFALTLYHIPFVVSIFVVITDIILSIILKESALGVAGLALANSIAFTFGAAVLTVFSLKYMQGKVIIGFVKRLFLIILINGGFVVVFWGLQGLSRDIWGTASTWENGFVLFIVLSLCLIVTLLLYKKLKVGFWQSIEKELPGE